MKIILFTKKRGCSGLMTLSRKRLVTMILGVGLVLPAGFLLAGYHLGALYMKANPAELAIAVETEMDTQRLRIEEVTQNVEENMNALAIRLGKLQAHVIRLDALGQRLTKMAKLEKGEFDFDGPPAQGGPVNHIEGQTMGVPDFIMALKELSVQLDDRSRQLEVLENLLMTRNLQAEVMPAGRPVKRGWLSSYFGKRTDPFTGRRVHHSGVDFAGRLQSPVVAVASGVVTFSGRRSGFGNLVEINHGNGYVTRYGHNKKNLVKVGDTVKKNQVVAKMGTTGRSTGPHVHFEVLHNSRAVNPKRYVHTVR